MTPTNHDRLSISPFRVDSLAAASPEAPDWLWRGYLAPGQLTLLTSLWKSGKTTLLSVLLARMKGGGDLLGMTVRPTRVLILSEENRNLWAMRQQRLDIGGHAQVICQPFGGKKPADADWRSLLDQSAGLLGTEGSRLLVIDTVATLMPTGVETNADCMVRALAPLRGLAAQGIAIWLMHHPHKGKPRAGQWSRGSGSLPASVVSAGRATRRLRAASSSNGPPMAPATLSSTKRSIRRLNVPGPRFAGFFPISKILRRPKQFSATGPPIPRPPATPPSTAGSRAPWISAGSVRNPAPAGTNPTITGCRKQSKNDNGGGQIYHETTDAKWPVTDQ